MWIIKEVKRVEVLGEKEDDLKCQVGQKLTFDSVIKNEN